MPIRGIPVSGKICQTLFGISAPYGKIRRGCFRGVRAGPALPRQVTCEQKSMKTAAYDARHTLSAIDYDIVSLARIRSLVTLPA
jgi:hypothetical protein